MSFIIALQTGKQSERKKKQNIKTYKFVQHIISHMDFEELMMFGEVVDAF